MTEEMQTLKESAAFLNQLLDQIDAAVLIVDERMRIHQFNRSFLSLFDRAAAPLAGASFGRISGCVNAVKENQPCGATSQCRLCLLNQSLVQTLAGKVPVERAPLERVFYLDGRPVRKHLEFSARVLTYQGRRMVLVVLHDVTDLVAQRRELEKRQQQIDKDLEAAAAIQRSLLPGAPQAISGLRTAWRFAPCQHVGGDIFQIFTNHPDDIRAYILDVCGHGVSAALVAVTVSQFLAGLHNRMRLSGHAFTPAEVVARLEQAFPLDRFDCFFTVVYAAIDLKRRTFVYSNAGHEPPILLHADGRCEVLAHHGTVIGTGLDAPCGEASVALTPGDRILLYTDGVIDNFGPRGERQGRDLMFQTLGALQDRPLEALLEGLFRQAAEGRGDTTPGDDMSVLAFEYPG